ncbi:hypothetical protein APR04_003884 [Promicromonospora umidemergens]|uniref:Uncharacterized protein n=3 Tax=Promicromonospora TaxID=43676 RepID=A0ABP8XJF9_9MICO|nr:hypothetical protein [Promicromonospora umidemergens]
MTVIETTDTPVRAVSASAPRHHGPSRPTPIRSMKNTGGDRPGFADPQGLRRLLVAVYRGGKDGWRSHPGVPALLAFCQDKYGALARRNGQSPQDAVSAAFEVLAVPSILDADDPWAVVTTAVQRTLQAQDRAHRLLCSTDQARRLMHSGDHDIARFCDLDPDSSIPDAVERAASTPQDDLPGPATVSGTAGAEMTPLDVRVGLITVRTVLTATGWPPEVARVGVDYVCERLRIAGSQGTAFEYLRREVTPLQLLGLDHRIWVRLCRVLLGEPGQPGLLARAVLGERPVDLLDDAGLVAALSKRDARPVGVRHG